MRRRESPSMHRPTNRTSSWPLARFAIGWLVAGLVVAAAMIGALRGIRDRTLPPLQRTELSVAARAAGCRVERTDDERPGNPPSSGIAVAAPAQPGVYAHSPSGGRLLAAVRKGVIVIHYRQPLSDDDLEELRTLQEVVPVGTIVTPNATRMQPGIAAVGWRRLLSCRRLSDATVDAIRLFRARNLGRGPDSHP